jgi:uncharacterized protein YdhG (YjbR/CyaY superfamily)
MASEIGTYIAQLPEPERSRITELYAPARRVVPEAVEGLSYAMPTGLLEQLLLRRVTRINEATRNNRR